MPRSALRWIAADQSRNQARPHVGEIGCDRIGERELGLSAAEQFGVRLRDERPGHGFGQIARGERALGLAGAVLDRRQHRLARRIAAIERSQRHLIDADDAHDLLDDIGLAFDVRAPGRHRDLHHRPLPATKKPRWPRMRFISISGTSRPARRLTSSTGKSIGAIVGRLAANHHDLRRRAAAQVEHHLGRQFETRHHEIRIDAALEAIARIGIDAELAAGLRDVDRIPERGFDQHVGGVLVAAREFAAHDAGERFHALLVGDHADRVVELVGLAVEREQFLARFARAARRDCRAPSWRRTHAADGRGHRS